MNDGQSPDIAGRAAWRPEAGGPASGGADRPPPWRRAGFWVLVLAAYGLGTGLPFLGDSPLMSHEALAAERTREFMTLGGWMVPHLNGDPDLRKPPLPFWIGGLLALAAGGVNEWTARLPSVAASIGTMAVLVFWIVRLADLRTAVVTGALWLTSAGALVWGRRAEVDMPLCFWTTAALAAYGSALMAEERRRQVLYAALMWVSLALSVLAKGPLTLAVLAVTAAAMAVFTREGRRIRRLLPVAGPVMLLAIAAPWGLWVLLKWPHAAETWYGQSLGRMEGELGHYTAWYYYLFRAPILWLPWAPLVPVGLYLAARRRVLSRAALVLMLGWGIGGLVFLSCGAGKRMHYALPVAPPFLVLAGLGEAYVLWGMAEPLSCAVRWMVRGGWLLVPGIVAGTIYAAAEFPEVRVGLIAAGAAAAAGMALALWLLGAGRRGASLAAVIGTMLVLQGIVAGWVAPVFAFRDDADGALGRWVASSLEPRMNLKFFRTPHSQVVYYAARLIPVLKDAREVEQWRESEPDGLLVLEKRHRPLVEGLGPWETVYAAPVLAPTPDEDEESLEVLRAAGRPGAAPPPGAPPVKE